MDNSYFKTLKVLKNIQNQIDQIQAPIRNALEPYYEMQERIASIIYKPMLDDVQKISEMFSSSFISDITKTLNNSYKLNVIPTLTSSKEWTDLFFLLEDHGNLSDSVKNEDDYLTLDEQVVKEFEIPESVVIPIGHNRVRMATGTFLTILGMLFSILLTLCQFYLSYKSSESQDVHDEKQEQLSEDQIKILQMQNEILNKLLSSVDASSSSQSDTINDLKKYTQDLQVEKSQAPADE